MSTSPIKLSIYAYAFNCRVRSFDLDGALTSFLAFADEVVVATLTEQEDDTLSRLNEWAAQSEGRLKVVPVSMNLKANNRFDGDLKTAALKECTHPVRIIADCDERFVASQRPLWDGLATQLLANPRHDGWMIPVIDLYGDTEHIRADQPIGMKLRMHKDTIVRRGVPRFAERGGGLFDTSQSDSTEPLTKGGDLGMWLPTVGRGSLQPNLCGRALKGAPYVVHYGFVDLQRRAELGRTFWKEHWERRSGKPERVATSVAELTDVPLVKHGLILS